MATKMSDRERAIRAKMLARYQKRLFDSEVELDSGSGTNTKYDNDRDDDAVANAENRNTGNVISITTALAPKSMNSQLNDSCGANSFPAIESLTVSSSLSTSADTTPAYTTKERASLSDAKRRLAASRMAVAAASATPTAGHRSSATKEGMSNGVIVISPRAESHHNARLRSFSASPSRNSDEHQSNASSLKAQRERFLRLKQTRPGGMANNGLVPHFSSSNISTSSQVSPIKSSTRSRKNQEEEGGKQISTMETIQTVDRQDVLQNYLLAGGEQATPLSTKMQNETSSVKISADKQHMSMFVDQWSDDDHDHDDEKCKHEEVKPVVFSEYECQLQPLRHLEVVCSTSHISESNSQNNATEDDDYDLIGNIKMTSSVQSHERRIRHKDLLDTCKGGNGIFTNGGIGASSFDFDRKETESVLEMQDSDTQEKCRAIDLELENVLPCTENVITHSADATVQELCPASFDIAWDGGKKVDESAKQPSETDKNDFANEWPEDSFSPTAWGAQQLELSFGESSDQWNAQFSQSRSSVETSAKDGWKMSEANDLGVLHHHNFDSRKTHVIDDPKNIQLMANKTADSSFGKGIIDEDAGKGCMQWSPSIRTSDSLDDPEERQILNTTEQIPNPPSQAENLKSDHNEEGENNIVDGKSTSSSTAYEGFRGVLGSCQISCAESKDDDAEECVDDDLFSGDDNDDELTSRSEGTVGTASDFDPLSMFGDELENENVLEVANGEKSVGNTLDLIFSDTVMVKYPEKTTTPPDAAAAHDTIVNRFAFETSPLEAKHTDAPPGVHTRNNRLKSKLVLGALDEINSNDDEDSIFSGLEEPMSNKIRDNKPMPSQSLILESDKDALIAHAARIEDDVFSGVSVTSRQDLSTSQFPRLKTANAMKSVLDGTSTIADSPSFLPPPPPPHSGSTGDQDYERKGDLHREKKSAQTPNPTTELFPSNESYGVINCQKNEHSPTNNSVTSDITSSVIFAGGVFRKQSFMKSLDILETTIEAFDHELTGNSLPVPPTSALENIDYSGDLHGASFIETSNLVRSTDQLTPLPWDGFSKNARTENSFVDLNPSVHSNRPNETISRLKAQFLSQGITPKDKAECLDGEAMIDNPQKAKLPFLSQFACGAFAASSYACCVSGNYPGQVVVSPHEKEKIIDFRSTTQPGPYLVTRSKSETCSSRIIESIGSESISKNSSQTKKSTSLFSGTSYDMKERDDKFEITDYEFGGSNNGHDSIRSVASDDDHENRLHIDTSCEIHSLPSSRAGGREDINNKVENMARSNAYHKLLLYAYTALSVPPLLKVVEKGEERLDQHIIYPPVLCQHDALSKFQEVSKVLDRLSSSGIEVLKLNREKNWQPRFLTITREVMWFRKSNDVRFCGMDSCPRGLLWVKKFEQGKVYSLASISKNGQGGIPFSTVCNISLMKSNHPLSRTQRKGKFKDSVTLVLASYSNETKRKISFRCMNNDDAYSLSSAFQVILDRLGDDNINSQRSKKSQLKVDSTKTESMAWYQNSKTPLASSKAFSPKVNDDRWEL